MTFSLSSLPFPSSDLKVQVPLIVSESCCFSIFDPSSIKGAVVSSGTASNTHPIELVHSWRLHSHSVTPVTTSSLIYSTPSVISPAPSPTDAMLLSSVSWSRWLTPRPPCLFLCSSQTTLTRRSVSGRWSFTAGPPT